MRGVGRTRFPSEKHILHRTRILSKVKRQGEAQIFALSLRHVYEPGASYPYPLPILLPILAPSASLCARTRSSSRRLRSLA